VAIDSTLVGLWDLLRGDFTSTATAKASAKLHLVYNVIHGRPGEVRLSEGKASDQAPWKRVGPWVRGHLLLFDLGYYNFRLFTLIDRKGGFFLTRAKTTFNGLITHVHGTPRGNAIDLVGEHLQDVLPRLKRRVFDVEVQVEWNKRAYRGKVGRGTSRFRLIGVWNAELGRYHLYLTNMPTKALPAESITAFYALRWQVELAMKALKSHYRVHHVATCDPDIARALIWGSLVSMMLSRVLLRLVRDALDPINGHIPHLRWSATFARLAPQMLADLLQHVHGPPPPDPYLRTLLAHAVDPNKDRFENRFLLNRS
jgi:hypothetical protein